MIHKIKSLYVNGNGLGQKAIAREQGISINTVRKYLGMEEEAIFVSTLIVIFSGGSNISLTFKPV